MSFIAVAAVVVSAGATAYSAYSASQGPDDPNAVFGKKPKIAPYTPIDLAEEQKKASESNLANIDSITALLDRIAPGFSSTVEAGMGTAGELVRGELPQEVIDSIMRHSAEMSVARGDAGTQAGGNRTLRDLGIGTLEGMQMGQNSAQQWTRLATDSFKPYLITTEDQTEAAAANNLGTQETLQRQYNTTAAPDPAAAGMYNLDLAQNQAMQQSINQFSSVLSTLGRQYNQPANGSWGRPYTGKAYVYDPASGSYVIQGG